jgi:hypothetical protein
MSAVARPDPGERRLTLAVGGTRHVPEPDPIAREYLLLALRIDQLQPGTVDGYFGPASLKAQVDMEQVPVPTRLRDDAAALRERVAHDVPEADRRTWLDAQLVALETHAARLAGEDIPYETLVARCMGFAPPRRPDAVFDAARGIVDGLLPGGGTLAGRLEVWDARSVIPVDRLADVVEHLVARCRARSAATFGLPNGEDLRIELVTNQPWGGYNWYDGGRRSRVAINTDLPVRAPTLIHTVAHETYPGHHLEHAWKEADLVDGAARLEASVLLINTPECPISEGLADFGADVAVPASVATDVLIETIEVAGLPLAANPTELDAFAATTMALAAPRRLLSAAAGSAAFLRHVDGWSSAATADYLVEVAGFAPATAAKRLEFIDHPLWRTYVFVYGEGETLVRRWVAAAGPGTTDREARFARLLHEQVTPAGLIAEIDRLAVP